MTERFFDVSGFAYAHRGLWGGSVPENSIQAFEAAREARVGVELDVRLTIDGLPVVFHDPTFERMCGDPRRLDEIEALDLVGLSLPDGSHIPPLSEVLDLMGDLPVLIELKIDRPGGDLAERVAALVARHPGRMTAMSFDENTVARLCQLVTDRPVGLLIDTEQKIGIDNVRSKAGKARAMGCDYLAPHHTSLGTAALASGGLPLVTWTVRTASELALARNHGAAAIFEGFSPDLAKAA